jgi:hypothetical protein
MANHALNWPWGGVAAVIGEPASVSPHPDPSPTGGEGRTTYFEL